MRDLGLDLALAFGLLILQIRIDLEGRAGCTGFGVFEHFPLNSAQGDVANVDAEHSTAAPAQRQAGSLGPHAEATVSALRSP